MLAAVRHPGQPPAVDNRHPYRPTAPNPSSLTASVTRPPAPSTTLTSPVDHPRLPPLHVDNRMSVSSAAWQVPSIPCRRPTEPALMRPSQLQ
ncbi:hypothetical protein ACLOJK_015331 [Asimina triloba]